jgi:hypothetical protein
MLSVIYKPFMRGIVMLIVVMLSVVLLIVVAPKIQPSAYLDKDKNKIKNS